MSAPSPKVWLELADFLSIYGHAEVQHRLDHGRLIGRGTGRVEL